MRRLWSLVVACVVCLGLMVPVSAADLSGSGTVRWDPTFSNSCTFPSIGNMATKGSTSSSAGFYFYNLDVPASTQLNVSGTLGVYFSYFFAGTAEFSYIIKTGPTYEYTTEADYIARKVNPSSYSLWYYDANQNNVPVSYSECSVKQFEGVQNTYSYSTPGFQVSYKFPIDGVLTGFRLEGLDSVRAGNSGKTYAYIPSFTVIATETSADLSAMESVADKVAEGNAIAQAMYGDIMSVLSQIKGDTGTVAAYMEEMFSSLVQIQSDTTNLYSLCSTYLRYLADIASTAESIDAELKAYHTDFMSMIEMLNGTIVDESGNIQAKMEEIYGLLIAYLDSQYAGAISPGLEQATGDAQLDVDRQEALEQGFQSNLTESWVELKLESFSLGGGYTSAMAWVSSWFTNFYNAMGDYGMIVLLPLFLGIVTMVTGLRRQAIQRGPRMPDVPPLPTNPMLPKGRGK